MKFLKGITNGLGKKIIATVIACLFISILIITSILVVSARKDFYNEMQTMGKQLAMQAKDQVEANYQNGNSQIVTQRIVEKVGSGKGIVYALTLNKDYIAETHSDKTRVGKKFDDGGVKNVVDKGQEYAGVYFSKDRNMNVYDVILPLKNIEGNVIGAVNVGLSVEPVDDAVRSMIIKAAVIGIIIFILAVLIFYYIIKNTIKNIGRLVYASEKMASGDLTEEIQVNSNDEIERLAQAFNEMVFNLKGTIKGILETSKEVEGYSNDLLSASEQNNNITQEITNAVDAVAKGALEQAVKTNDAKENVSSMTIKVEEVVLDIENLKESTETLVIIANRNKEEMNAMNVQMNAIKNASVSSSETIRELMQASEKIGDIVNVINGIAEQTNLLALNAAIEAARAGEQGRGFAVVADEIRKLAEESVSSAKDITELIKETQEKSNATIKTIEESVTQSDKGQEIVKKVTQSFENILESIKDNQSSFDKLEAVNLELKENSNQVMSLVEEIQGISENAAANTQQVAASTEEQMASSEEISASIESLNSLVKELSSSVDKFKI